MGLGRWPKGVKFFDEFLFFFVFGLTNAFGRLAQQNFKAFFFLLVQRTTAKYVCVCMCLCVHGKVSMMMMVMIIWVHNIRNNNNNSKMTTRTTTFERKKNGSWPAETIGRYKHYITRIHTHTHVRTSHKLFNFPACPPETRNSTWTGIMIIIMKKLNK